MKTPLQIANEKRNAAKALKKQANTYKGPESDIQEIITQCANDRGIHLIHVNDQIWERIKSMYCANPDDYFVTWFLKTFKHLPDCIAFKNGFVWSAELKKEGGKLSQGQIKKVSTLGAKVFFNAHDAVDNFNKWLDKVEDE